MYIAKYLVDNQKSNPVRYIHVLTDAGSNKHAHVSLQILMCSWSKNCWQRLSLSLSLLWTHMDIRWVCTFMALVYTDKGSLLFRQHCNAWCIYIHVRMSMYSLILIICLCGGSCKLPKHLIFVWLSVAAIEHFCESLDVFSVCICVVWCIWTMHNILYIYNKCTTMCSVLCT